MSAGSASPGGPRREPQRARSPLAARIRPRKREGLSAHTVANEVVLLAPDSDRVYALNETGRAVWTLCDGIRGLDDIASELRLRFEADDAVLIGDVSAAVFDLHSLGLVDIAARPHDSATPGAGSATAERPNVRFVFGCEDRPYFHWQLAILFESLVGQLPDGWDVTIVVCNDGAPISPELDTICRIYGVRVLTGTNLAAARDIDFAGGGEHYVPMHRVEALAVVRQHVDARDVVCLMDTDIFLCGELQEHLFPTGNAMARNWIISEDKYFGFSTKGARGVSLPKLIEALGCSQPFKPGGVTVFLTGATLQTESVVPDIFRFLQVLYLLGKILDAPQHGVWVAEMACFALAMYPNGIDYELLDVPQFSVLEQHQETVPEGSFFHYYTDINDGHDGPFFRSEWHKQLFHDRNMLLEDFDTFARKAQSPLERQFFALAEKARDRLYGTKASTRRS